MVDMGTQLKPQRDWRRRHGWVEGLLVITMMNPEHVIAIDAMLKGAEATLTDECCIYRVPFKIRRHKEDAYTPMVVSIGPFHHNTLPRLHNMERHKLYYCKAFLQRTQTISDTWIRYIESVEATVRRSYSETLPFSKEELVKIIFVDSGFILELFYNYDACLLTAEMDTSIRLDMLLLENQLPFFVLEDLFKMSTSAHAHNSNIPSFIQLTFSYFNYYNTSKLSYNNISIKHFTDLLRTFHPPPSMIDVDEPETQLPSATELSACSWKGAKEKFCTFQCTNRVVDRVKHELRRMKLKTKHALSCHSENRREPHTETHLPGATELSEAGVKFEVNSKNMCLLDFRFKKPVLKIPQLKVEDSTEMLFRNMVALEQCQIRYRKESYITDYVQIMDFLINTSQDVDFLVRKGILINWLGDSNSVANLFNGLCKNIIFSHVTGYRLLYRDLNAFHKNRWNNLKSSLRRDYCKTPWKTAATFAAIILLILTLVQTICSILQVKSQ
ncbi:hypothetical protein Fmac_000789 [Flemingia macrophylla]|uniref:Uncharacterized protein n=1 Tax=Flemingia macrophylla TaxID=520843 RepID=A0ABD1NF85_9FABA